MLSAGKEKWCEFLIKLAQAVSNYTYWCAAISNGNEELLKSKLLSLLNHVCDIHEGHGDLFPSCEDETFEHRKWITKGLCYLIPACLIRKVNIYTKNILPQN